MLGVLCAGGGGELFVRGTVGLARCVRVSPGIIGATVAAFATSSPELAVAISSAAAGKPQISLGNVLGGNVVNVALILACALLISGLQTSRDSVKRDFSVASVVPVITGVLLLDGVLSRIDGILLLAIFLAWIIATIIEARKQRSAAGQILGAAHPWQVVVCALFGLALLWSAGRLIVTGARGIAADHGLEEFIIGATIVAVGTSVPELATTVIAKLRGQDEVGLGTILGSNIFNGLFVVPVAAVMFPIAAHWRETAVALVFGLLAVIFTLPSRRGWIERRRGVLLLVLYAAYLTTILQRPAVAGW